MLKNPGLNLTAIAVSLFGICCTAWAQEQPPVAVRSWDLNVDTDYAARMAKQLKIITLKSPTIVFLDNQKIAVTYEDGRGASPSDGTILVPRVGQISPRERAESPLYKFHALIFDVDQGPGIAKHLEWDAIREQAQLIPTHDGGFVVRVDNQFMVYSYDAQLQNKMTLAYHGDKPLATGEEVFQEYYKAGISNSGRSLIVCHTLRGRESGGGTQVAWYDRETLKQIGQTSQATRATGCGYSLNARGDSIYIGQYTVGLHAPVWKAINPRCIKCNDPVVLDHKYERYVQLDEKHLLILEGDYQVLDLEGHEYYTIASEPGIGLAGPTPATNAPRIAYGDRQSKSERGHRWSTRLYVVDWKQGREIAALKFIQDALPAVHGGGLQLEALGVSDFAYALSPDGKKLAVLSMNSLKIYDLP
ncbi:MAG TPA: hypothetical protein VJN64_08175 [Terriglobales bacterium]|nr:hypothetical protein [Terriglobales bacterium]